MATKKKSTAAELLRLASATHTRLEQISKALNDKRVLSAKQERAVRAMYAAAYPKGPAWVEFVDAIDGVNSKAPLDKAAVFVIEECTDMFPELANVDPKLVEAAITGWRRNISQRKWKAVQTAMTDAIPGFKVKWVTMRKQWPRLRPKAED